MVSYPPEADPPSEDNFGMFLPALSLSNGFPNSFSLRLGNTEVTADFSSEETVDFRVTRDSRNTPVFRIDIHAVFRPFANKHTTVVRKITDKIAPLHGGDYSETARGCRMVFLVLPDSLNVRAVSKTNTRASFKFSFASRNVFP